MTISHKLIVVYPRFAGAKRVDELSLIESVHRTALLKKDWSANVEWARPTVGPKESTVWAECVLAVSDPDGLTVAWVSQMNVAAPTRRKAAESCLPGSEDLWDLRISNLERKEKAWQVLVDHHTAAFSPLERLALAADQETGSTEQSAQFTS